MTSTTKLIATALATLMLSTAMAPAKDIAASGAWRAFTSKTKAGQPLCGIVVSNSTDTQSLYIKWFLGDETIAVQAIKQGWRIPEGTPVRVELGFDGEVFGNTTAVGTPGASFSFIEFRIATDATKAFMTEFRQAKKMWMKFPDGNETAWFASMEGSREITAAFAKCIAELERRNTQPFGKAPATQPFGNSSGKPAPGKRLPPTADERGA